MVNAIAIAYVLAKVRAEGFVDNALISVEDAH
jgi:hypothetical protein